MEKMKKLHPEIGKILDTCEIINKEKAQIINPKQQQEKQPGSEKKMHPKPIAIYSDYQGANKLKDKVVLITGGDSGIGRAVAYHCHAEGAKIAFSYLDEHEDAKETYTYIKEQDGKILEPISANLAKRYECKRVVEQCVNNFGTIDILINNIAVQQYNDDFSTIDEKQLEIVFHTNFYSYFYMCQFCLPFLKAGNAIINSTSVTAYRGSSNLVDYSATKGAIVAFTRSLAKQLAPKQIRVNAVAPGPVWTPLIPSSFPEEKVTEFGKDTFYGHPAQPADIAPSYIFLAARDSSFITGQVLHPNGGEIINS